MPDWIRVKRGNPCPICDHIDWCLVSEDGSAVLCPRTELGSQGWRGADGGGGYLHILDSSNPRSRSFTINIREKPDFTDLAEEYRRQMTGGDYKWLSGRLGVSIESLERLQVGRIDAHRFSWPMSDGSQIIGIRIRTDEGQKYAVSGSMQGLFLPCGMDASGPLLITEGNSDFAAALTLGFDAIGRPSCSSCVKMTAKVARSRREIVIVGDTDGPGHTGAQNLADSLRLHFPSAKMVFPPDGIKDLRAWLNSGLKHDELQQIIDRTESRNVAIGEAL